MTSQRLADSFAPAAVFAHLAERLSLRPEGEALNEALIPERGDHAFHPLSAPVTTVAQSRPAAVLVGLVARPDAVQVLLTQRASALRVHSGQIAFPGGKIDPEDVSPAAAALREAREEIGLDARHVETIGYLDPYLTSTGFRVVPVVARVEPGFDLALNAAEVDDAFEVPLAFLMNEANHALKSREWKGAERFYYEMPYDGRHIWGVTAGILRNFYERLYR